MNISEYRQKLYELYFLIEEGKKIMASSENLDIHGRLAGNLKAKEVLKKAEVLEKELYAEKERRTKELRETGDSSSLVELLECVIYVDKK